jgi:hypothetical protein
MSFAEALGPEVARQFFLDWHSALFDAEGEELATVEDSVAYCGQACIMQGTTAEDMQDTISSFFPDLPDAAQVELIYIV